MSSDIAIRDVIISARHIREYLGTIAFGLLAASDCVGEDEADRVSDARTATLHALTDVDNILMLVHADQIAALDEAKAEKETPE